MFIVSLKLSGKKFLLCAFAVLLAVSTCVVWLNLRGGDTVSAAKTSAVSDKNTQTKVKVKKISAKTNDQRVEFIRSFGWEIETEASEVLEVVIPKEFDDVYRQYNSIQKEQGFDLAPHAGKRCKRYSYTVMNYPDKKENVRVNLLVRDNKIIGGDVCLMEPDGFMHGFAPKSPQ